MDTSKLLTIFAQIDDPRSHINKLHELEEILLIGIISVMCGAETWEHMVSFSKSKEEFLKTFLKLPHGIPSKDTLNRTFAAIDSEQFESCFIEWVSSLSTLSKGQVIAIDGKTIRGAKEHGNKSPIHMVSAWACDNNLVLGQVKTHEKSNEITAIPELLKVLQIEDSIITIDAMGCQEKIATAIVEKQADYILAVKQNQKHLYEDIELEFRIKKPEQESSSLDFGHGRIETRKASILTNLKDIEGSENWKNLKSIIKIESIREFKNSEKPTEKATRFYISSLKMSAEEFEKSIRSHWAIENKLHWTLDVAFGEDASRKRAGNAAQNYSTILKIALNVLKNDTNKKGSVKSKRLEAAWNQDYLEKLLKLKV
jgi:predicted transposase YbfD/YdcC